MLISTSIDDGPHADALVIHLAVCQYVTHDRNAAIEVMDDASASTASAWLVDLRILAEDRTGLTFCPARALGRKVFPEHGKEGYLRARSMLARRRRGPRGSF